MMSGSSIVLSVPKEWLDENGLSLGDEVLMIANGDLKFMKIDKKNIDKLRHQLSNDHGLHVQSAAADNTATQ